MKIYRVKPQKLLPLPAIALALTLIGSACSSQAEPAIQSQQPDDSDFVLLSGSLEVTDNCDSLLERIKEAALERVGPYGLDQPTISWNGGPELDGDLTSEEESFFEEDSSEQLSDLTEGEVNRSAGDEAASAQSSDESDAKAISGTNNQEEGVDEADLVKSDGKTLAIVTGNELQVLDVAGTTPQRVNTISLQTLGQPSGMFLNEDHVVLLSVDYSLRGEPTSLITEIELDSGEIKGSAEFEGQYVSSREVDGTLRIVTSSSLNNFGFVYPDGRTDESEAEEENSEIIEQSKIEDWIPNYRVTGDNVRRSSEPLVECDQVHIPKDFSGGGQVAVVTVDLDRPLDVVDALTVHTDAQTVYASTDRLIVAAPQWPTLNDPSDRLSFGSPFSTALHSFDTTGNEETSYVASGSVRGLLLNQFSLSEHEGNLRVATTDESPNAGWDDLVFDRPIEFTSESFVSILSENDEALETVGQVGGLGKGETIFAVRFIGNVGYVVTFRQTDPLYTVDLSDPSNPAVLGELKIPGFSNYLHEVDEQTLLGVGSDGTESGQILGAAVSLFDVEDLSDPTRLDKLTFNQNSSTPVAEDAKAFTYWRETNTAIVPVQGIGDDVVGNGQSDQTQPFEGPNVRMTSQAAVIDVDPETGRMEIRGTIDHKGHCDTPAPTPTTSSPDRRVPRDGIDVIEEPDFDDDLQYCDQSTMIARTMIIGDDIYTFSSAGIAVNDLENLDHIAWVSFN